MHIRSEETTTENGHRITDVDDSMAWVGLAKMICQTDCFRGNLSVAMRYGPHPNILPRLGARDEDLKASEAVVEECLVMRAV